MDDFPSPAIWGGYGDYNLYNNPEKRGFRIVGIAEKEPDCDFEIFAVWQRLSDRSLWYASDSGCSCPCPFEDHTDADLTPITGGTYDQFKSALRDHSQYSMGPVHPGKQALARKVRDTLRRNRVK